MNEVEKIKAVAIIIEKNGKFAAIKAKQRNGKIGFLAGHIEADETIEQAAIRESLEEGNLVVAEVELLGTLLASKLICALVYAKEWSGELESSSEGEVFWATEEELTGSESAYPQWNEWAIKKYKLHKNNSR